MSWIPAGGAWVMKTSRYLPKFRWFANNPGTREKPTTTFHSVNTDMDHNYIGRNPQYRPSVGHCNPLFSGEYPPRRWAQFWPGYGMFHEVGMISADEK